MRSRRRRRTRHTLAGLLLGGAILSAWWVYRTESSNPGLEPALLAARVADPPSELRKENNDPKTAPVASPSPPPPPPPASESPKPAAPNSVASLIESGKQALAGDDLLSARKAWSEAFRRIGEAPTQEPFLRSELARVASETILSPRVISDDPSVERYVIRAGDLLAKIAATNRVSADFLAAINGLTDKNQIREGQSLKVIHGPFRAVVHKSAYLLDVFLDDTFVRSFSVGLGADDRTPTGEWRVGTKLVNPTYYPPRGGAIVSADDPKNPLGERWIGLLGISGAAVEQQRYGIHGTNEPESIGKSLSMGCVRLRNEDVELLYTYLVETHSTVTVLE